MTIDFGVMIKCGLKLTFDQYDGLRYALSHCYDEGRQRHVQRTFPGTSEYLIFCVTSIQ